MKHFLLGSTPMIARAPDGGDGGGAPAAAPAAGGGDGGAAAAGASTATAAGAAAVPGSPPGADGAAAAAAAASGGSWLDGLSDDHRAFINIKGYKSPADLIVGYHNAEKAIGLDKVAVPKEDSPQEVKDAFFNKLGRPAEAQGYELKAPEGIPDYSPELGAVYGAKAHALGLTKAQANGMFDWFMDLAKQGLTADATKVKAQAAEDFKVLEKEWGVATTKKVEAANRAIAHYGGDEAIQLLKERGLHSHPVLNRLFAAIGEAMGDDTTAGSGGGSRNSFAMTPEEAKAEIARMDADAKHPAFDKRHPEHKMAVERRHALFAMAYHNQRKAG